MYDSFVIFSASFLIWVMLGGILVLWVVDGKTKKEVAVHALFAAVLAWVFAEIIKNLIPTLRPFETNGGNIHTFNMPMDASFPSGHAAFAFAVATSVFLHDKKLGKVFVIAALLVAWGRMAANVHYFQDIVAGGLLGIATSYLVMKLHLYKLL